jgi:hypothetical protein
MGISKQHTVQEGDTSMATSFNQGKPYHGSDAVCAGKLQGATDTDYFYFFCSRCEGKHIVRLLDYEVRHEQAGNPYNDQLKSTAPKSFILAFKLHCEKCDLTDFVKIGNLGLQGGEFKHVIPG